MLERVILQHSGATAEEGTRATWQRSIRFRMSPRRHRASRLFQDFSLAERGGYVRTDRTRASTSKNTLSRSVSVPLNAGPELKSVFGGLREMEMRGVELRLPCCYSPCAIWCASESETDSWEHWTSIGRRFDSPIL